MMMNRIKQITYLALTLVGVLSFSYSSAHSGATGVVKQRMDAMSDMADAMKVMANVVKGKQAYDAQLFVAKGNIIANHSAMLVDLFPVGSIQASSESTLLIWQQWDDFVSLADSTKASADKMVLMAEEGTALRPMIKQFVKLGGGCKACHKDYRKKK
ncbi:MAG: cytochrome c [Gammaproteobacteria bacterium]|nr:cytochrome c [Gammaproteobacteria bacterium]